LLQVLTLPAHQRASNPQQLLLLMAQHLWQVQQQQGLMPLQLQLVLLPVPVLALVLSRRPSQ
jgi:hypothetical protein